MKRSNQISLVGITFLMILSFGCQTPETELPPDVTNQEVKVSKKKIQYFKKSATDEKIIFAYIGPKSVKQFKNIKNYRLKNGQPAITMVSIFAANLVLNHPPYLRAQNNPDSPYSFNKNIRDVLGYNAEAIKELQAAGIKVLITILGAHHNAGWSCFGSEREAQDFVNFLKHEVIDKYGFDGIDIDDEYSSCNNTYSNSLAMVATIYKRIMPNKLLTKALWSDSGYFNASWNGNTLGQHLDFGAEMSYGSGAGFAYRLAPYLNYLPKGKLMLGFTAENRFSAWEGLSITENTKNLIRDGYRGVMLFDYENQPNSINYIKAMVEGVHGPGNWHEIPAQNN